MLVGLVIVPILHYLTAVSAKEKYSKRGHHKSYKLYLTYILLNTHPLFMQKFICTGLKRNILEAHPLLLCTHILYSCFYLKSEHFDLEGLYRLVGIKSVMHGLQSIPSTYPLFSLHCNVHHPWVHNMYFVLLSMYRMAERHFRIKNTPANLFVPWVIWRPTFKN